MRASTRLIVILAAATILPLHAQNVRETALPAARYNDLGGSFIMYDRNADTYNRYNPSECNRRRSPASTFKILNSLIGLETGVITDEHFVIPWDSVVRPISAWNRDHDLASAIANSVVPYYQELARRVGEKRMRDEVTRVGYGNNDISGGIDRFWLGSSLRISPLEQLEFLRRLYDGRLPFSPRSIAIVKKILVLEKTDRYTLRGKTGFAKESDSSAVGWFVGYVEKGDNVYFFACNLTSDHASRDGDRIFNTRKETCLAILKDLGVL